LANDALLESWELSLHEKRPRTVDYYLAEARRFVRWLEDHGRPEDRPGDLAAVTKRDVELWLSDLRAQGLSQSTLRSRWIVLRALYGWALREDEVAASPLERVTVAKANPPAPNVLPRPISQLS
jgi:site-specific recombinase XerD